MFDFVNWQSHLSLREKSISLCDLNTGASNLEFIENDGVEQNTVKSIKSEEEAEYSLWERVLQESGNNLSLYKQWWEEKVSQETEQSFQDGPGDYLNKNIFPILLLARKDILFQARQNNFLKVLYFLIQLHGEKKYNK